MFENLEIVISEFAAYFAEAYIDKVPVASGGLKDSIYSDIKINGTTYQVVLYLDEIWKYIEYGREPGKFPPPDAMLRYIEVKNIMPRPITLPTGRTVLPTIKQLAFLFGRKIYRDGIKARPLLQETLNEFKEQFYTDLAEALKVDGAKLLKAELLTLPNKIG